MNDQTINAGASKPETKVQDDGLGIPANLDRRLEGEKVKVQLEEDFKGEPV